MQTWPTAEDAIRVIILNARLPLLIAAVLCHCHAFASKPAAKPAPEAWVERKLDRIIIPRLQFRDASFVEAVEFLRKETRRLDPRGTGIPIMIQLETSTPVESPAPPVIHGLPPEPNPTPPGEAKMTVSLSNIPLREALHYDPESGHFTWLIPGDAKGGGGRRGIGRRAGRISPAGYIRLSLDNVRYRAHRLAWLYMTGNGRPNRSITETAFATTTAGRTYVWQRSHRTPTTCSEGRAG